MSFQKLLAFIPQRIFCRRRLEKFLEKTFGRWVQILLPKERDLILVSRENLPMRKKKKLRISLMAPWLENSKLKWRKWTLRAQKNQERFIFSKKNIRRGSRFTAWVRQQANFLKSYAEGHTLRIRKKSGNLL